MSATPKWQYAEVAPLIKIGKGVKLEDGSEIVTTYPVTLNGEHVLNVIKNGEASGNWRSDIYWTAEGTTLNALGRPAIYGYPQAHRIDAVLMSLLDAGLIHWEGSCFLPLGVTHDEINAKKAAKAAAEKEDEALNTLADSLWDTLRYADAVLSLYDSNDVERYDPALATVARLDSMLTLTRERIDAAKEAQS